jgi:hypothetical protein
MNEVTFDIAQFHYSKSVHILRAKCSKLGYPTLESFPNRFTIFGKKMTISFILSVDMGTEKSYIPDDKIISSGPYGNIIVAIEK